MRKYFLDNLRWGTIMIVLAWHVFFLYNSLGALGGIGGFYDIQPWDVVCTVFYPWMMPLLFVIAGACARYALCRQSAKEFILSKNHKLLVPSTLGLFVYQYAVGYLNLKIGGGWDMIPAPIHYFVAVLTATGPLWFIQMLWLFSLLLVLIRKLPLCEKLWTAGRKAPIWLLLLLFLPIWGASHIGNPPYVTMYRFGIYGLSYLLGYFVFSHDTVQERLRRWRLPLLGLALVSGAVYTVFFYGQNYYADETLRHILTNLYLWMMVLAAFGCGKQWLDRTSPFAAYMTRSSFGIYVVHYLIVMLLCLGLKRTALPVAWDYILAILLTWSLSPLVYELLRRIPVIRYITFGIRTQKG